MKRPKTKHAPKRRALNCRPAELVSYAGKLLRTEAHSASGVILATKGKKDRAKRRSRGCAGIPGLEGISQAQLKALLSQMPKKKRKTKAKRKGSDLNGPAGVFKLTDRQKRKLHPNLQKAILRYHLKKGEKVIY